MSAGVDKLKRVLAFIEHGSVGDIEVFTQNLRAVRGKLTEASESNTNKTQDPTGQFPGKLRETLSTVSLLTYLKAIYKPDVTSEYKAKNEANRQRFIRREGGAFREILLRHLRFWDNPRDRAKPFIQVLYQALPEDAQEKTKSPLRVRPSSKARKTLKRYSGTKGSPRPGAGEGGGRRRSRSTRKNIPVRGFAVVHSAEKPWVKEPNYRRWLAKLRRHTVKVRKHGEEKHPDNMCVNSEICKGDLGIPRRLMPQFTSPRDIQSFTKFAEKRYGIKSRRARRRAGQLRPSQEEINQERVEDVADDIRYKKLDPNVPLIVSADGFVIDGHHRWAAYKKDQPKKSLPVLLVKAPARDVLSVAATWGAKHHQF
jgi:hypothetical protein